MEDCIVGPELTEGNLCKAVRTRALYRRQSLYGEVEYITDTGHM